MDAQNFNQWTDDSWSAEPWRSELANTTLDSWPNYLWLDEANPTSYDFGDKKISDDFDSNFSLPSPLSPTAFGLPSPISDYSQSEEASFDPSQFISPWDISTPLSKNTINTAPSAETLELLAKAFPYSASTASTSMPSTPSSSSYSPKSSNNDFRAKKSTKQTRKSQSEKSQAKSPIHKTQKAHNLIEKRYRNNLNEKINALRDCIPTLRSVKKESDQDEDMEDDDAGDSKPKCNKGVILGKAISYIAELEKQVEKLTKENTRLQFVIEGSLDSYLYANGQPCRGGLKSRAVGRVSA